jgi:hypothetical protein
MKKMLNYCWLAALLAAMFHGGTVILNEWQRKSIHAHGELLDLKVETLNCPQGWMSFYFGTSRFEKKIDARTCALLNPGQKIKLKHSRDYPETFLFVNEQSPNRFIMGSLEILLGIIGLLANWPLAPGRRTTHRNFPRISDN